VHVEMSHVVFSCIVNIAVFFVVPFSEVVVPQIVSDRRWSLLQNLRKRRPTGPIAKQRKIVRGTAVAIDSFVEDSQDSLPQYSGRKPAQRRAWVGGKKAGAERVDLTAPTVEGIGQGHDDEEADKYNLLESTEELELPCRHESDDQMTVCAAVDADVTVVTESSYVVNASATAAADTTMCQQLAEVDNEPVVAVVHSSSQIPQPLSPPVMSESHVKQAVSKECATRHSCPSRLSSLPTQQLDGQLDTPATSSRKQSSVDKVGRHFSCVPLFVSHFYTVSQKRAHL